MVLAAPSNKITSVFCAEYSGQVCGPLEPVTAVQIRPGLLIIMTTESIESEKAYERYKQIVDILNEEKDQEGLVMVQNLVEGCIDYAELITILTAAEKAGTPKGKAIGTSSQRGAKHNYVIDQLEKVNRYLFKKYGIEGKGGKIPIGGIYSLDPYSLYNGGRINRWAVADWAYYLQETLFRRGIIKRGIIS